MSTPKPRLSIIWPATALRWGDGAIYYGIAFTASAALADLAARAAASAQFDDKNDADEERQEHEKGLVSRDCGEVYLPGETAQLVLLVFPGPMPFYCRVIKPSSGLDHAHEVEIHLPGKRVNAAPGAYVLAAGLDEEAQERIYKVLCHDAPETLSEVYRRIIKHAPPPTPRQPRRGVRG